MLPPLRINGKPHWEVRFPKAIWPAFEDFRYLLCIIWDHLGLPAPTEAQLEIAHRLQYGADSYEWSVLDQDQHLDLISQPRNDIIRAFRGVGKSYVTAAFVIWRLMRNPRDEKVLVISATANKSKAFVSQCKNIMATLELCSWLLDGTTEHGSARRDQAERFDVAGASLSQAQSVMAKSITGQITGDRATLIVPDDIEIEQNARTEDARQRLIGSCREFDAIAKTEHGPGDIIFLGTPQTEESIYNTLVIEQGYRCFCIPARYPAADKLTNYEIKRSDGTTYSILAPYLRRKFTDGILYHNLPTDPQRFDDDELIRLEAKGRSYFALQFQLDTTLSDAERYPLRQTDLIIMSCNPVKAPLTLQWGKDTDKKNLIKDIPNLGFSGDILLYPLFTDKDWTEYDGSVLFVDPAGRGADETAWAIVKSLNGILYCLHVDGFAGDPAEAMRRIALDAKRFNVNVIEVEPNFGQGMWVTAFGPVLAAVWDGGCTVQESEWAKGQKEKRIIDTLEPVLTQHRLVLSEDVARREAKAQDHVFSLVYQLTHITQDRGALKHDDRLDALAGAVAHFMRTMGQSTEEAAQAVLDARWDEEIADFEETARMSPLGYRRGRGRMRADGSRPEVIRSGAI